jgi:iron(III) transport system permease protein
MSVDLASRLQDGPRPDARGALRNRLLSGGSTPTILFRAAALVLVGVLAALVVVPLLTVGIREFSGAEGSPFAEIWDSGRLLSVLGSTLLVVVGSTLLATAIGATFAWLNERTNSSLGRISDVVPIVPLLVPSLAGSIGWILLASAGPGFLNVFIRWVASWFGVDMGTEGPLDVFSWYGLVFLYVLYLVPHVYLTVAAALRNLDPALEEASRMSGAGPFRTLRKVTLPAILPSIFSGAMLALVFGLALFSVPILIATPARIDILSVEIVNLTISVYPAQTGQAVAFGIIMTLFIASILFAQARLIKGGRQAMIGGKASRSSRVDLGLWRWPAKVLMLGYLAVTSVLPLLALVVVSLEPFWTARIRPDKFTFASYRSLFSGGSGILSAFRNSILLGVVGATVAMLIAAVVVFACRRLGRSLSRSIQAVTKLPSAFSHVVIGVAFIAVFVGVPFQLQGTLLLLFLGYLVVYLPQATFSAESAMGQIGPPLVEASATCGGSDARTFRKVVLPLLRPGLTAGWVFVFILMAGDVTMSVMLASTSTPVVGFTMIDLYHSGTYPLLAAMGVIITVVSGAVVIPVLVLSRGQTAGVAVE